MYKADRTRRRVVVHGVFISMSTMAYLGIDVAKRKVDVALLRPDGKVRSKAVLNTTAGAAELLAWVARYHEGPVHACLEATGTYGLALAEALADAGYVVSLVNPARIAAYARSRLTRSKTDAVDARLIAEFCAKETPPRWVPPTPPCARRSSTSSICWRTRCRRCARGSTTTSTRTRACAPSGTC